MDDAALTHVEPDQNFAPDEVLYRRFAFGDLSPDGRVDPESIKVADCSFNRSKYSEPGDVLSKKSPHVNGVASIRVEKVPPEVFCDNSRIFVDVKIVHDPDYKTDPPNPAHTEMRTNRRGDPWVRGKDMSRTVQRKLREIIVDNMVVVIRPTPSI